MTTQSATPDGDASARDESALPDYEAMTLPAEFLLFLKEYKSWWMAPIGFMVLLLGALTALGVGPAAPFIYSLF